MKARIATLSLALFGLVIVTALSAQDTKSQNPPDTATADAQLPIEANCPVSGGAVNAEHFVERDGKKIYFCCENCPAAFKADPDKFAAAVNYQLLQTAQMVQVACPLSGGPLNPEAKVKVGTKNVTFCCENCQGKVAKMEQKEQIATVFGDVSKGFTMQTECPLSGHAIAADQSVEHEGQMIYFCCEDCVKAFKEDPAKYADKIAPLLKKKDADK
jgi:YHS domain-containing protein